MDRWQVKAAVNLVSGATPLGLLVAAAGRARVTPGPRGLLLAHGYRLRHPRGAAFTVGNVVLTRDGPAYWASRPRLLLHEERHSWQYVACLGLPLLPLYLVGAAWSLLRGGDPYAHNAFERLAGLDDGGYPALSRRARRRRAPAA